MPGKWGGHAPGAPPLDLPMYHQKLGCQANGGARAGRAPPLDPPMTFISFPHVQDLLLQFSRSCWFSTEKKIMVDQDLALLGGGEGGGLREMNCQIIGFCPSLGVSTPTPVYEILDLPQRYSQSHWYVFFPVGTTPRGCSSCQLHSQLMGVSGIVPGKIMEWPGTMRPVVLWIVLLLLALFTKLPASQFLAVPWFCLVQFLKLP